MKENGFVPPFSRLARAILLLAGLLPALSAAPARAALSDTPTTSTWVTDGPVYAIAATSSTVYLGGAFSQLGQATEFGLPLSAASGQPAGRFPMVNGAVYACTPDGAGGWYIGGAFTKVGALERNYIAHIFADGSVDADWAPNANSDVFTLAVSGGTVYVGGRFDHIGGAPRNYLAALDAASGVVTAWDPAANGLVKSLVVSGNTIFVAGNFYEIGGQTRNGLAALDVSSGAATAWDPCLPSDYGTYKTLAVAGDTVYVGGEFFRIGGQERYNLAALDASNGAVKDWNPNPDSWVQTLAVSNGTVYIGGWFDNIGGQARQRIGAVDATSGAVMPWNPTVDGLVSVMTVSNGTVYVGGDFSSINGQERINLAALDASSGAVMPWNPRMNDEVKALAVADGKVYVGGIFTMMNVQMRKNLAALDASTGALKDWNPNPSNEVRALAVSKGTIYAGGRFSSIGGQMRYNLAALDASSGVVKDWNPITSNLSSYTDIKALAVSGGTVYVGGNFSNIGGRACQSLAALDASTGAVRDWNLNVTGSNYAIFSSTVYALAASGGKIFVGGNFVNIGGKGRNFLAALDATSGTVTDWPPNPDNVVRALAASGETIYVGGDFSHIGDYTRKHLAALDASSGAVMPWSPNTEGQIQTMAVSGGTVLAGGAFNVINGQTRSSLAALGAASGAVKAWDPILGDSLSPYITANVYALAVTKKGVYVGGYFSQVDGQFRPNFALFEYVNGPPPATPASPGATEVRTDRITWKWKDTSEYEDGFKIWADPGMTTPTTQRTLTGDNVTSWVYRGLMPNTPYTFQVAATNDIGDSSKTAPLTAWTQIEPLDRLEFSVSETSLNVTPVAFLSNLTSGSSGTCLENVTAGTTGDWYQGTVPWTCTGLTPNTQYLFTGKARNAVGVETTPTTAACTTLAAPPVVGGNVTCDHAPGPLYSNGTAFTFTNPAGFGAGTHGGNPLKVSRFRYGWATSPTHYFSGDEPSWSSGVLTLKPTATGQWYLHLQSINAAGVAGATLAYGPFSYDHRPPALLNNTPNGSTWVPNGPVNAIARTSDTVYLGGQFSYVGPATGSGVLFNTQTGAPTGTYPKVDGLTQACAPDGAGGWFIGGRFNRVGGLPRNRLAHILADGSVDQAWNPGANDTVCAIAVSGGKVYIGGYFTSVGGQKRNHLAALDPASGAPTNWAPSVSDPVYSLGVSANTIYIGGSFTNVGGLPRNFAAALDAASGAVTDWSPNANGNVNVLAVSGSVIYAGGTFDSIGGQARKNLAALDASSGLATKWNPEVNNSVYALAVAGSTLYAGGWFTNIGGQPSSHLAALDATSGTLLNWNPGADSCVYALALSDGKLYAGGGFSRIGGRERHGLAALDPASGAATAWNPNPSDDVYVLAASAGTLFAGGQFTSMGGVARGNLAALDAASGTATDWNPEVTGAGLATSSGIINALAISGETVYVGGDFSYIGGETRYGLAAVNAVSGILSDWKPDPDGPVRALAISGETIYAGGGFYNIGGRQRRSLAALDASSGQATGWTPNLWNPIAETDYQVHALAISSETLYVGGHFKYIGGKPRYNLAALDRTSALATSWRADTNDEVRTLAVSSETVYAGGYFTYIGGEARQNLAALDRRSGGVTAWAPTVTSETDGAASTSGIHALDVSGGTIFVGGHFTGINGEARTDLAALDAVSGTVLPWNPGAIYSPDPLDGDSYRYISVNAVSVSGGTAYAGSYCMTGDPGSDVARLHPYFAQFDSSDPPSPEPIRLKALDIQPISILLSWIDASDTGEGFKIWADPGSGTPTTQRASTQAGVTTWFYGNLTPNTQYAIRVAPANAPGGARSALYTTFTLAARPVQYQNVQTSQFPGSVKPVGTAYGFTNPAGFGAGTHGGDQWKTSAFRWVWDTNPTHVFSGKEPLWNAGTLSQTASSAGNYTLHLQSINAAGVANPFTLDLGPFYVIEPPKMITPHTERTVNPGDTVNFSVTVRSSAPLTYQWAKDGEPLVDNGRISGSQSATLSLNNASWQDSGLYICRAKNLAGYVEASARLTVNPTLTVASAHGAPSPAVGTKVYAHGTLVTAQVPEAVVTDAAGTTRWICTGWTATGSAPTNSSALTSGSVTSVSFKIGEPTTITWQWKEQYKLTATADPSTRGSVTLADGVTVADGSWHDAGTKLSVRAVPAPGSRFAFWSGALSGRTNPASLTLNQPASLKASFEKTGNGAEAWSLYKE